MLLEILLTLTNLLIYCIGNIIFIIYRRDVDALIKTSKLFRSYRFYFIGSAGVVSFCLIPAIIMIFPILISELLCYLGLYTLLIRAQKKWQVVLASILYFIPFLSTFYYFHENFSFERYTGFTFPSSSKLLIFMINESSPTISLVLLIFVIGLPFAFFISALRERGTINQNVILAPKSLRKTLQCIIIVIVLIALWLCILFRS